MLSFWSSPQFCCLVKRQCIVETLVSECGPYFISSLLLHAKVKEYSQCYAIANIWLRWKDNIQIPEYKKVVTLYIRHVMMPQEQVVLVPQFLNSCTVLSNNEKEDIISQCEKFWDEQKRNKKEKGEMQCTVDEDDDDSKRILSLPEMREKDPYEGILTKVTGCW